MSAGKLDVFNFFPRMQLESSIDYSISDIQIHLSLHPHARENVSF